MKRIPYVWLLIIPSLSYAIGWCLNALVIAANHGMPVLVYGALSCGPETFDKPVHICMTTSTHLKFLGDWVYTAGNMASPGDYFEWFGEYTIWIAFAVWAALMVKDREELQRYRI